MKHMSHLYVLLCMKTVNLKTFNLAISYSWECPNCKTINKNENLYLSPYTAISENLPEEVCVKCNTFVGLSLYEDLI